LDPNSKTAPQQISQKIFRIEAALRQITISSPQTRALSKRSPVSQLDTLIATVMVEMMTVMVRSMRSISPWAAVWGAAFKTAPPLTASRE